MPENSFSCEEDVTEGSLEWWEFIVGLMDEREEELTLDQRYIYG